MKFTGSYFLLWIALVYLVNGTSITESHTPIASRWTYNEHLFPIFRDNCGSCHKKDGIAPMSLVTYQEAYPWAQSIREEILDLRMPPWQAEDGFGDFSNGHALSAKEMDMILEWSSGGYPQGPRNMAPDPVTETKGWSLGEPELELSMTEPFTLDASTAEVVRYFVLPTGTTETLFITGADVIPGALPVVRDVAIYVDGTGTARELDAADAAPGFSENNRFPRSAPIALWSPGQKVFLQDNATHTMDSGSDIVARIHYKKTWITEGESFSDNTRVGLYFSNSARRVIESMLVTSPATIDGLKLDFNHTITDSMEIVAVLPEIEIGAKDVQVIAVTPTGKELPLLFLREPNNTWPTRYWFNDPIKLPSGSSIEVNVVLHPGARHTPGMSLFGTDTTAPIRLIFEYSSGRTLAN